MGKQIKEFHRRQRPRRDRNQRRDGGGDRQRHRTRLSIADASAAENAGHLLFEVTLSRALQNTVKVDFETISGGTATEGEDYHARRTYTHVILAGEDRADGLRAH